PVSDDRKTLRRDDLAEARCSIKFFGEVKKTLDPIVINIALVVGGPVIVVRMNVAARACQMAAWPAELHVPLDQVRPKTISRRWISKCPDVPAAEPEFGRAVASHIHIAGSHAADAQVQPLGGIVTDASRD